jgi:hypothetical protein
MNAKRRQFMKLLLAKLCLVWAIFYHSSFFETRRAGRWWWWWLKCAIRKFKIMLIKIHCTLISAEKKTYRLIRHKVSSNLSQNVSHFLLPPFITIPLFSLLNCLILLTQFTYSLSEGGGGGKKRENKFHAINRWHDNHFKFPK